MNMYRQLVRPLLFQLSADTAHDLAEGAMATGFPWGLFGQRLFVRDPRLAVQVAGLAFTNPVGLAAGLDKDARNVTALGQLGFGYTIAGSIMPQPRTGNPRPRLGRYPERESLINCLGQPSDGLAAVAGRLSRLRRRPPDATRVLAIIGGFSVDDYVRSYATVAPLVDAVEISTKCPNNVDDGGEFLRRRYFEDMVKALAPRKQRPLFVKMLPWRSEAERQERLDLVEIGLHYGIDGFTLPGTPIADDVRLALGWGTVSGRPVFPRTLEVVHDVYAITRGRAAIKALGGIASGQDAFDAIAAGADLVELLTAFVYQGWRVAWRINTELAVLLTRHGLPNLAALRGSTRSWAAGSGDALRSTPGEPPHAQPVPGSPHPV